MRNEVHLCAAGNGHELSVDCWCEPTSIRWHTNQHGVQMLVVEHNDTTLKHRILVISERERDRALPYGQNEPDAPWITRVLTLPPFDPNERKLR